jgi:hypothetical protein
MKVYRGPESKDFLDDSRELVDTKDLSKEKHPWTGLKNFRVNLSKESTERQSIGHIVINAEEITTLHQGLVAGLLEKSNRCEIYEEQVKLLKKALSDIKHRALVGKLTSKDENFEKIKNIVEDVFEEIKK